jgi:hypothetical protein
MFGLIGPKAPNANFAAPKPDHQKGGIGFEQNRHVKKGGGGMIPKY